MADIKFNFLGNPDIQYKNKSIVNKLSSKSLALLAYLVMHKNKTFTRSHLASLLWSSSDQDAAFSNLRYNFWYINKTFNEITDQNIIYTKKDKIKIMDSFEYELDVENLKDLKDMDNLKDLEKINVLYKGAFLEGFYLKKCIEYNDWVFYERESIQRTFFKILKNLLKIYNSKNMYNESIDLLEKIIKMNPYDEDSYCKLINIFLKKGDRKSALDYYNKCVNVLREELNVSPKNKTKKLLKKIQKFNYDPEKSETENKKIEKINNEKFEEKYRECSQQTNHNFLINCTNNDIDYYHINVLLKKFMNNYKISCIEKHVEEIYLKEISNLCIHFEKEFGNNLINDNPFSEIRLLDSILQFIISLSKNDEINIFIKDYSFMDQKSKEIFQHLNNKSSKWNYNIIINN